MAENLTIFITTYERPLFLQECLESIHNQSYKKFKIIILDNSESNRNSKVIENFKSLNIQYIKNTNKLGAARNIQKAYEWEKDTKYFMIFHDDDKMHPEYLEKSIGVLENNDSIVWIGSNYSSKTRFNKISKLTTKLLSKKELIKETFKLTSFSQSSLIFKSDKINQINYSDYLKKYSIIADRPILLDLIKSNDKICLIENKLCFYRIHEEQDSKTSFSVVKVEDQLNYYAYYRKNIDKKFIDLLFYNIWISNTIFGSFERLNNINGISIFSFLKIAKSKKLINNMFPLYYILGRFYYSFINLKKLIFLILKR